jgi:hypothetical protein
MPVRWGARALRGGFARHAPFEALKVEDVELANAGQLLTSSVGWQYLNQYMLDSFFCQLLGSLLRTQLKRIFPHELAALI